MKNTKWLISAVLALIIVAVITFYTEAYLDVGRNAFMLFVAFAVITLLLRFLLACFAAIKSAAPQQKQQLNGDDDLRASKACAICGKVAKPLRQAKDGIICADCYAAAGFPAAVSISLIPVAVLKDQIDNAADGKSIIKRFKESGGALPETKKLSVTPAPQTVKCPRCQSSAISADKKWFGIGKAVVGAAVAGPIGLVAGNMGAKKVRITCLNCGYQWYAGKA